MGPVLTIQLQSNVAGLQKPKRLRPTAVPVHSTQKSNAAIFCKRSSGWISYDNYTHITQPDAKKTVPNCDVSRANGRLHQTYGDVTLIMSAWQKYDLRPYFVHVSTSRDHMSDEVCHWHTKHCNEVQYFLRLVVQYEYNHHSDFLLDTITHVDFLEQYTSQQSTILLWYCYQSKAIYSFITATLTDTPLIN